MLTTLILGLLISPALNRQATLDLEARVRNNPADASAHLALCRTYYVLENFDDSISECQLALKLAPTSKNHDWLGRAYGAKAEHASWVQAISLAKKVRVEFEAAVAADPNDPVARRDLGQFYLEAPSFLGGSKDRAEEQAAALDKMNKADALYIRARRAELEKDNSTAEALYQQSVAASGKPADYLAELAGFYRRTNQSDRMQATVVRIAQQPETGTALYDGAATLIRTGKQLPTAISLLRRYIAAGGTEDAPVFQAYYQLGLAYQKMGDKQAARDQFRQATEIADYAPAEKALNKPE